MPMLDTHTNLLERHGLRLDLLADEAHVGAGLQGTLEGDVGSGTSHEADEVVVLLRGQGVELDVSDLLTAPTDKKNGQTQRS